MDRDVIEKLFEGLGQLMIMLVVLVLIALVTIPLAIWKIVDLLQ